MDDEHEREMNETADLHVEILADDVEDQEEDGDQTNPIIKYRSSSSTTHQK